jgi:hypothetical protein
MVIFGTLLTCLGVGMFCGAGYTAMQIVIQGIFVGLFHFYVPWLESIEIGFFAFAVVMGAFAMVLVVFGFLASSATRQNIYSGVRCIMGGRIAAFLFLVLTYLLNFAWLGIASFCGLAIIIYLMLQSVCHVEVKQRQYQYIDTQWGFCLNLSRFGIYKNYTEGLDMNALCDEQDLDDFCDHITHAGPLFCVSFAGAFLIVLGLVTYSVTLSANYSRIQTSKEITNYRQVVALDDTSRQNDWM